MKVRSHNPETKAAVIAALLTGQSISSVAKDYNIPEGTVKNWSVKVKQNGGIVEPVQPQKRERIGELIVNYLEALLITLHAQQKVFQDEKWLKQQSASEVAVLHGVLADKGIRLLEALADKEEPHKAPIQTAGDVPEPV